MTNDDTTPITGTDDESLTDVASTSETEPNDRTASVTEQTESTTSESKLDERTASKNETDEQTASEHVRREGAAVLEADAVAFSYGDVQVFRDVSMTVEAGAVSALIGPNGTGKTTLLKALAGLESPTAGSVDYRGPSVAREIGYLPQQPAFRPGFSVIETLEFYASLVGEGRADALARLEQVGLSDAADRDVDALSGGMTRLVGIAQAAIGDPPVVVLDEPASGLDPGMSTRIYEVAREIAAEETAVLLTSHDMGLVERAADVVYILDDGGIVERGAPAALVDRLGADSLRDAFEQAVAGDLYSVRVQGETA